MRLLRFGLLLAAAIPALGVAANATPLFGPGEAKLACRAAVERTTDDALARARLRGLPQDEAQIRARGERQFSACMGGHGEGALRAMERIHDATVQGVALDMRADQVVAILTMAGFQHPSQRTAAVPELVVSHVGTGAHGAVWDRVTQIRAVSADETVFMDIRLAPQTDTGRTRVVSVSATLRKPVVALDRAMTIAAWSDRAQACDADGTTFREIEYRSAPPIAGDDVAGTTVLRTRAGTPECKQGSSLLLERVGGIPVAERDVRASDRRVSDLRY